MGYFGTGSFENDPALDWLPGLTPKNLSLRLRKTLLSAQRFKPENVKPYSRDEIEDLVGKLVSYYRTNPLPAWEQDADSQIKSIEAETREHFVSGRYLDEEYGPLEEAIAASEVIAIWAGVGKLGAPYSDLVEKVLSSLSRKRPPAELAELAVQVLGSILANKRYARMREFFLSSSGLVDSDMKAVRDLRQRIKTFITPREAKSPSGTPKLPKPH
jgi:hypothetical protein